MIQILLLALLIGIAFLVANEGPQSAAITFVSVLFSGLLAMNFFEPLANLLSSQVLSSFEWQHRWDVIALLGIFAGSVALMRLAGDRLFPTYAPVTALIYHPARWGLGILTGYTVMAMILTSLHVAPLPREFLGFTPEGHNFFGMAPDRQWLALTQYVSEYSLQRIDGSPRIFDGVKYPAIPNDVNTSRVWSSFPIRYAARRELFTTGKSTVQLPGRQDLSDGSASSPPAASGGSAF